MKEDFHEIKNNLHNIKNIFENKKKILNKNKTDDKEKEEKIEQPSKKKTTNKKSSELIDVSTIVAKISKIDEIEKDEMKDKIEECKTPVVDLELQQSKEMIEPEGILVSPAQNKNLDSKESLILSNECVLVKNSVTKENSSKKIKLENVRIIIYTRVQLSICAKILHTYSPFIISVLSSKRTKHLYFTFKF